MGINEYKLKIATVGAGAAAWLHINAYKRVHSVNIENYAVCDSDRVRADRFAQSAGINRVFYDFEDLLADTNIDVIDISTPPFLHQMMISEALNAGRHVICEKPLSGYFGLPGDPEFIGKNVSKAKMFDQVCEYIETLREVIQKTNRKFMYAENFIYAPMVTRAGELLKKSKSKVVFSCSELHVRGSTSPVAGLWSKTGGGSLIRNGCHLISAILFLKQQEAQARNEKITINSVVCETGCTIPTLSDDELRFISARPKDVEDFANVTLTFSDTSKAVFLASDAVLGGNVNTIRLYANDCVLKCDVTPSTLLETYYVDGRGLEGIELNDRVPTNTGWEHVDVSDETLRGYVEQFQDFTECAKTNRQPKSSFEIAEQTLKVIYAAYLSAETGKRVNF